MTRRDNPESRKPIRAEAARDGSIDWTHPDVEADVRAWSSEPDYPDLSLITRYLAGELSAEDREQVEERLRTDAKFRAFAQPIIKMWELPGPMDPGWDVANRRVAERTWERLRKRIEREQLGIEAPHLAVAALNPHGGEDGLFGREEIEAIRPAIETARARGMNVSGPVPADSVFHMARIGRYDAVLSLYHDQGHIAAKMMDFEKTVSVTLGLPILRTSVDHGTAFDIAGTGRASAVSMVEAIKVAAEYVVRGVRLGDHVAQAAE